MVPWVVCEGRTFCWRKSSFSGYFSMFSLQMFPTNKPTSHPLQCHERNSSFHTTSTGNLTSKKRIQRHRVSLLYSTIRRSDKYPSIEPYRRTCKRTQPIFHRSLLRRRIGQGWKAERHPYTRTAYSTPSISQRTAVVLSRMQGLWSS